MIPYGHVERDLCAKASKDAGDAINRALLLCETKQQAMLVAQQAALGCLAIAAGATQATMPGLENASVTDIMLAIVNMAANASPQPEREEKETGG